MRVRGSVIALTLGMLVGVASGCSGGDGGDSYDSAAAGATAPTTSVPVSSPAPRPAPVDWNSRAERAVRAYYKLLNRREFGEAWSRLSPAMQGSIGDYDAWLAGYDYTEGTDVESVSALSANSRAAEVQVVFRSDDLDACGDHIEQSWSGTWSLERVDGKWLATAADVQQTAGAEPVRDAARCPDWAPVEVPEDYEPPDDRFLFNESPDPGEAPYVALPNFCEYNDCIPNFPNGTGYPIQCADGSWSSSGGRPGACSWHGGVGP